MAQFLAHSEGSAWVVVVLPLTTIPQGTGLFRNTKSGIWVWNPLETNRAVPPGDTSKGQEENPGGEGCAFILNLNEKTAF